MKISVNIVIAIITLLCVLPFVWFTLVGKRRTAKQQKIIKDLIKGEDVNFNHKEFWNQSFIGVDDSKNRLLFSKLMTSDHQVMNIDLNEVKSCKIDKITREFNRDKKVESQLQKLNLELAFNSQKPNAIITIYDIEDNLSEDFEMKRAEKWQKVILDNLIKMKPAQVAA